MQPDQPRHDFGHPQVVDDSSGGHHGFVLDPGSPEDDWSALAGPDGDGESWRTPERAALVGWLNRYAPALEPLYRGALLLAAFDSFPGRVHFITHAIREIGNSLPSALGPKVKKKEAGYGDRLPTRSAIDGSPRASRRMEGCGCRRNPCLLRQVPNAKKCPLGSWRRWAG